MKKAGKHIKKDKLFECLEKLFLVFVILSLGTSLAYHTGITGKSIEDMSEETYSSALILITLLWLGLYLFVKNLNDKSNNEGAEIVNKSKKKK